MRYKLAIIATHPIQYQVPVWKHLAQQPDLDIHVYYGSDFSVRGYMDSGFSVPVKWDVPLTEGYSCTFLSKDPSSKGTDNSFSLRTRGLRTELEQFRPHVALINAYSPFFWWKVAGILYSMHIPIILRAETTDVSKDRHIIKKIIRSTLLRYFYHHIAYFLAIGQNSRNHYLDNGIVEGRIGWSPYCVDTEIFASQASEYLPQRAQLRQELGFNEDQTVFLFSGKLFEKKDPLVIIHAIKLLPELDQRSIGILVVGDGVLRKEMEDNCQQLLKTHSVFAGFVNQMQLGRFYAVADCLILPSCHSETWGLVVNEALQFGIPAIVSDRVGCGPDLIVEGETGYIFPNGNAYELKNCLMKIRQLIQQNKDDLPKRCCLQVDHYSIQAASKGIKQGILTLIPENG